MKWTFRQKALFFMVAILVLVSSIHTYEAINTEKDLLRTEIIKRAEAITTLATRTGELPIISGNPELLKKAVSFLKGNPEVVFAALYDRKKRLLIHDGVQPPDFENSVPSERSLTFQEKKDVFDFYSPVVTIRSGGDIDILQGSDSGRQVKDTIGWARIGFSKSSMKKAEDRIVRRGLMLALAFVLGSGVVGYILLSIATRPLVSLYNAVKRLEKGEYPQISSIHLKDEIGELSRAFDMMSRAIRDREARLVNSEKKLRELFERVEHAIFRLDMDGNIIETNRQYDELCGGINKFCALFADAQRGFRIQREMPREMKNSEERILGKGGGELIVLMSIYSNYDDNGGIKGFDGYFVDVTEKKRLEENLIQSQKLDSLGLLAGGIAHDFNNILSGVLGYATLVRSKIPQGDVLHKYMDTIVKSTKRASNLTRQLLGFARKGKYRVERLNVNDLLKELASFLKETFDRSIVIVTELARELPLVEGDGNQLYQAILNLCLNARDAMPDGGRLYIHTDIYKLGDAKVADIFSIPPGEYVRISVTDTGTGVTSEVRNKMFEPFYTTKDVGKGTGLGLSMVYGIVKNHGGYITVYSEPGLGTTMRVYIPRIEEITGEDKREKPMEKRTKKGTILLIDDEEVMRELAKDILEAYDYEVLFASDGDEGTNVFRDNVNKINLVILDMIMPKKGGRQVFKEIRSARPDAKVLICSGYGEEGYLNELLDSGVAGFLQKPFQHSELLTKVRDAMER